MIVETKKDKNGKCIFKKRDFTKKELKQFETLKECFENEQDK